MGRLLTSLILMFALTACTATTGSQTIDMSTYNGPYLLDSGDQLRVVVYDQPELTNVYRVEQAGYISMPLAGDVVARNLTTAELERSIEARLGSRYLRNPDVTVEVLSRRPFFMMGEVNNSGQFAYQPGTTVRSAIAMAGGFTPRANQRTVKLTRAIDQQLYETRVNLDEPLLPGDTIFVFERLF